MTVDHEMLNRFQLHFTDVLMKDTVDANFATVGGATAIVLTPTQFARLADKMINEWESWKEDNA